MPAITIKPRTEEEKIQQHNKWHDRPKHDLRVDDPLFVTKLCSELRDQTMIHELETEEWFSKMRGHMPRGALYMIAELRMENSKLRSVIMSADFEAKADEENAVRKAMAGDLRNLAEQLDASNTALNEAKKKIKLLQKALRQK